MGEHLFSDDRFSRLARFGGAGRFSRFVDVSVRPHTSGFDGERWFVLAFRRYRLDILVPFALLILNP